MPQFIDVPFMNPDKFKESRSMLIDPFNRKSEPKIPPSMPLKQPEDVVNRLSEAVTGKKRNTAKDEKISLAVRRFRKRV